MKIKKYLFRIAITLAAFAMGCGAYAQYRYIDSFFRLQPLDRTMAPLAKMEVDSIRAVEVYGLPAVYSPPQTVTSDPETETPPYFDPTGVYCFSDDPPKGFEDFDYLEIVTMDYEPVAEPDANATPIPPTGAIRAKRNYKFRTVAVSWTDLAFETEASGGVSYKFTGKFKSRDSCETDTETPSLKGKLVKMKNGKRLATTNAEFFIECGC